MRITEIAIKYRTAVVVLTVILSVLGLLSYVQIPKESQPSFEIPIILITTIYPGASPDDIESLITQEVESKVQDINGIKEIRSTSTEGASTVVVEFNPEVSMDEAYQKVRDRVAIAKPLLPADVEEPVITEIDISEFPIMTINLAADYSLARLKDVAEDLQDELETIASVLEVDLIGGLEREVQVNVDLNALQGYNLAFEDVIDAIRNENVTIPGGSVKVDRFDYLVRISGEFQDPVQIQKLVVKAPEASPGRPAPPPIYVRDVAEVVFGFKDRTTHSRLKVLQHEDENDNLIRVAADQVRDLQVISLNVKKRTGENILETVAQVKEKLASFPTPPGTQIEITGDQSEYVEALVEDLENNIISGLLFVVAVLLFFLGVRNALLVGIAIPLSMFVSFLTFSVLGYTLNFIILFSLIIALGMLVDNAIVIVENIVRFREEGYGRFESANLATSEVGGAVVASTATTLAAFAPMLFWPGIIGQFMSYLPITLIITLSSSLFVAILINPVITGIFARLDGESAPRRGPWARRVGLTAVAITALLIGLLNPVTLLVLVAGGGIVYLLHHFVMDRVGKKFVSDILPRIISTYKHFLHWMLERDYSVRRAYLRNTFVLVSLTLGFILLIAGFVVGSIGTPLPGAPVSIAGLVLLVPGGLLLLVGIVGTIFHTLESMFLGGAASLKAGLVLGVIMLGLTGVLYLTSGELNPEATAALLFVPALLIVSGTLGTLRRKKSALVLTDNRARLMNTSIGLLFIIVFLYAVAPTGVEFFPSTDPTQIQVVIDGPLGTTVEASNQYALEAERRLSSLFGEMEAVEANVANVVSNVGVGGNPLFGGGSTGPERSTLALNLVDYQDRAEPSRFTLSRIRDQLRGIPGTEVEIQQDSQGPPTGSPVNIEIAGDDFETLVRVSREIKARLIRAAETGAIPGLVDVRDNLNTGRPELSVNIDPVRAAQFGLNTRQIASTIRTAINGADAGSFRDGKNEYDITVRLNEGQRSNIEDIKSLTVLYEGAQIPVSAVADVEILSGLGSITRLDLQRVVTIEGGAAPGFSGPQVLGVVQEYLEDYVAAMPSGISVSYTGESEDQAESFGFLRTALLIGLALIFMIMVAQFNSISGPFIIMIAVGLSFLGVMLGLIITRLPFGLMTFIGIISLAGIVVNNNIVLLDYAMKLRERGLSKRDAIITAGATRLRPVLLTAFTTVLGLIPLTFGINIDFIGLLTDFNPNFTFGSQNTQFWGPMGTTIISGLTFATFLTLVIVPVMYSLFDSVVEHMGTLIGVVPEDRVPETDRYPETSPAADASGNGAGRATGKGVDSRHSVETATDIPRPSGN